MGKPLCFILLSLFIRYLAANEAENCVSFENKNEKCIVFVNCESLHEEIPQTLEARKTHDCNNTMLEIQFKMKKPVNTLQTTKPNLEILKNIPDDMWKAVTIFQMINQGLEEVPSQIYQATNVTQIDLSHNKLNDTPDMTRLPNLENLDLSYNNIHDGLILSHFKGVKVLNFANNNISFLKSDGIKNGEIMLQDINLSHNAIETIPAGYFEGYSNVISLDLSSNEISGPLFVAQFRGLKLIKKLLLSHNHITDPSHALVNLPFLKMLSLDANNITYLTHENFEELSSLEQLTLSSNAIMDITDDAFIELEKLKELDLSKNKITKITAQLLRNNKNLTKLFISDNEINHIDSHSFKNNQINELTFDKNKFEGSIDMCMFDGLCVTKLDLSNMGIKELKPDCLISLSESLVTLNLAHNHIKVISGKQFTKLNHLKNLDLSHNEITELIITDSQLQGLEFLNAGFNEITRLDINTFHYLINLNELDLSHNKINYIQEKVFDKLKILKTFKCTHCELTKIDDKAFDEMSSLETLDLSENELEVFTANVSGLSNVKNLNLNNNKLMNIDSLKKFINLETLNAAGNQISSINTDTFTQFNKLRVIDLAGNKKLFIDGQFDNLELDKAILNNIGGVKFNNVTSIKQLDLSHCGITNLTSTNIKTIKQTKRLLLNNNFISEILENTFEGMESLEELDLGFNKIQTIKSRFLNYCQNLKSLNLENNNVSVLEPEAFYGLENLNNLRLSDNKIPVINNNQFIKNQNLQELYLEKNNINYLFYRAFDGLSKLKKLNLIENQLIEFGAWLLPSGVDRTDIMLNKNPLRRLIFQDFSELNVHISIGETLLQCEEIREAKQKYPNLLDISDDNLNYICTHKETTPASTIPTSESTTESTTFKLAEETTTKSIIDKIHLENLQKTLDSMKNIVNDTERETIQNRHKILKLHELEKKNRDSIPKVTAMLTEDKTFKTFVYLTAACVISVTIVLTVKLFIRMRAAQKK